MSANVGSGSDMALYVFGTFVWNPLRPRHAINETVLTASSVVVMGLLSPRSQWRFLPQDPLVLGC